MKVITDIQSKAHIEQEIDRHVKSIQKLIARLGLPERQKYYDGLLSHILHEEIKYEPVSSLAPDRRNNDYSRLSATELKLIRELSVQMERMYRTVGDTD